MRGWLSIGMVVIQPYILVSKLKKIKRKFNGWIGYPNFIKTYRIRFIAYSSSCTTTGLSKLVTSCLTAVESTANRYMKDSVRIYFGLIKIQVKF